MSKQREQSNFFVPTGWSVDPSSKAPTIVSPKGDLAISFVELAAGANVQETALSAWRVVDPKFASKPRGQFALPRRGTWDEMHQIVYDVPDQPSRLDIAIVRRLASRAYVNLVRGSETAINRRAAQLGEAIHGWKPAEYQEVSSWSAQHGQSLIDFIRSAMAACQIPGVAIAVVHGGRVVLAEGFGVRSLGDEEPVTPRTRFMIGSMTRPLTTLLIARLVELGKLTWSTRIRDLHPGFALADPAVTNWLALRHTASAPTGMPGQDLELLFSDAAITPEQRIAEMKNIRPAGRGEPSQYSNLLVALGGYAAARAFTSEGLLENAFERAMAALVFRPLGMNDTVLRQDEALDGDAALPHALSFYGNTSRIPLNMERAVYRVAPAGAAWSTVLDMSRYLLLELGDGRLPEGDRMIAREILLERRNDGVKIGENARYSLGLTVSNDSGRRVIHHDGATLGFSSDMFFLPEGDLGAVVLTNAHAAGSFLRAVRQKIFELVFGAEPMAEETIAESVARTRDEIAQRQRSIKMDPASAGWINELTGRYVCDGLGSATLARRGDGFWIQFYDSGSAVASEIQPNGYRILRLISPPWRGSLGLLVNLEAKTLTLDAGHIKYVFERQPPASGVVQASQVSTCWTPDSRNLAMNAIGSTAADRK